MEKIVHSNCRIIKRPKARYSPGEYTQDQVEHEERADDNEGDEVQPVPCVP